MNQYATTGVSPRSFLIAGVSAAIVGAAAVTPVSVPDFSPARIAGAIEMMSITTPLEVAIKNTYNFVEPWAAYGAAWGQYVLGLIPGLWWLAPGVSFGYYTAEPLVRAGTYSFADVVGLNFAQIGPDINTGIQTSINNGINYGLAWLNSLVPFPPLPPIPPLPGASVAAGAAALPAAATDLLAAPEASSITTPIEDAIKNTYNFVEPWAAYGAEWAQYILGFIPGLWWVAPGVDLAYYTIEPLVQAGVYTLADVIGLDFAQIGPDISAGIETSINNAITYGLAWLNSLVPFPPLPPLPPFPGASVAASAASVPAVAAVESVETGAAEADAEDITVTVAENESPAPAAIEDAAPAAEDAAPAAEIEAAEAETAEIEAAAVEAAEAAGSPLVSEQAQDPGRSAPAAETTADTDDGADDTERPSRATRAAGRG